MRTVLDGQSIGDDDRIRIYFGEHTLTVAESGGGDHHLHPPSLGKLLFISPPPSPPLGWEIREEEPPNRDVHAEDLQRALAGLGGCERYDEEEEEEDERGAMMGEEERVGLEQFRRGGWGRRRSGTVGSVVVYHPRDHGDREDLPAVMVEDTEGLGVVEGEEEGGGKMWTHTARPPVELMEQ